MSRLKNPKDCYYLLIIFISVSNIVSLTRELCIQVQLPQGCRYMTFFTIYLGNKISLYCAVKLILHMIECYRMPNDAQYLHNLSYVGSI